MVAEFTSRLRPSRITRSSKPSWQAAVCGRDRQDVLPVQRQLHGAVRRHRRAVQCPMSEKPREGIDFFPLSVDFEEKLYSVGRIPGSFMRREGRPGEKAILTSRVVDRPIRPLSPRRCATTSRWS